MSRRALQFYRVERSRNSKSRTPSEGVGAEWRSISGMVTEVTRVCHMPTRIVSSTFGSDLLRSGFLPFFIPICGSYLVSSSMLSSSVFSVISFFLFGR